MENNYIYVIDHLKNNRNAQNLIKVCQRQEHKCPDGKMVKVLQYQKVGVTTNQSQPIGKCYPQKHPLKEYNLTMNESRNDSKLSGEPLEELAELNTRNDVITFLIWIGLIETGTALCISITLKLNKIMFQEKQS
ncbi:hypothetical protein Tsp_00548 [Trichinella spiralis]|uniref:hypothetical protein n=1 Tax=Trichinella spiralis TaxID=6334 RepID=UPI0001EFBC79|nr:hypothetical protein Tsp_00548 [Trichinella spiralis]